jgi:hypothetical protein
VKSPAAKAKNDKKFFEKLARRNNPIRSRMALPDDVKLEEIDWHPDFAERGFSRLAEIDRKFEQAEKEYRKARISILEQMRDADLKRIRELS